MARRCPPTKLDRALTLFERDAEQGLAELERLADKYAKDPSVRHAFGSALMSVDEHWRALDHLSWAERKEPTLEHRRALAAAYQFLAMPEHAQRVAARESSLVVDVDELAQDLPGDMPRSDRLLLERARTAALHGEDRGIDELTALAASYPACMALRNAIATARYANGDLEAFSSAARAALDASPDDVHALLNAVRLALLEEGPGAAAAHRDRVRGAAPSRTGMLAPELARAEALAYLDDAEGTADSLAAWRKGLSNPDLAAGSATAVRLGTYLQQRQADPRAPLFRLEVLLFGWLRRWSESTAEVRMSDIAKELAGIPGVFALAPVSLGWEQPWMASMLVHVLLAGDAPDPPGADRSWVEVLRGIVERDEGVEATLERLRGLLDERRLLEEEEAVTFVATSANGERISLDLFREPIPSGLPADDDVRYEAAMSALLRSDLDAAESVLADLHQRHPDAVGVEFNLALTQRLRGGPSREAAHARLERIAAEHPDYLFAKAQLAIDAIEAGELDRARAYLELPDGVERFHVIAYANLHAAEGRLALAEQRMDDVERILASIHDLVGEHAPPYQRLKAALGASGRRRAEPGGSSSPDMST
jgi:hypothetical protein